MGLTFNKKKSMNTLFKCDEKGEKNVIFHCFVGVKRKIKEYLMKKIIKVPSTFI